MRQNTKVIVASSDVVEEEEEEQTTREATTDEAKKVTPDVEHATPSQRRASQQTWTSMPWNGKQRRPSARTGGNGNGNGMPRKKPIPGPAPPLPGKSINVEDVLATAEEPDPALNEQAEEGEERGRLFVKVIGVKDLDLPLPKGMFQAPSL